MTHPVNCPYCNAEMQVNDDLSWGAPDLLSARCTSCKKNFKYKYKYSVSVESEKAPCLNGGKHNFVGETFYKELGVFNDYCNVCKEKRSLTKTEYFRWKENERNIKSNAAADDR